MVALIAAVVARPWAEPFLDHAALQTWATIFVSITVQAMPFLVLGVVVSGAIAAFVPSALIARLLPDRPLVAVPAASVAGAVFPGCECGSVPVAGRLTALGAAPAAAFAFMLAAPAINPVVLVATAVAFPGRPDMVVARLLASFATAVIVGFVWARFGRSEWLLRRRSHVTHGSTRWEVFAGTARHDFLHAGGWLVVGSVAAAALQVVVPRSVMTAIAGTEWLAILVLAALAVLLAICSEADAFVAASLTQFSLTARLVFLVVGPVVDIKLIALHTGVFGRAFAVRFAPLTFVTAVVSALIVGWWLL
ncbi:permease [Jiangella anatolica]|nr:permease [Jiangella anatolica]